VNYPHVAGRIEFVNDSCWDKESTTPNNGLRVLPGREIKNTPRRGLDFFLKSISSPSFLPGRFQPDIFSFGKVQVLARYVHFLDADPSYIWPLDFFLKE